MSPRIYTATNANCIVGGQPPDGEPATIREDFEAGVSLVVDTAGDATTVRGAVPAHRDAPEALVGVVTVPDGDDPLRRYHDAVREVFDERSWRIRTDVINGQLFDALGRAGGSTPDGELLSSIQTGRTADERVEVGAPDPRSVVGLLRALLERPDDGVFVVSTQEPPDHVETDVFVHLADRYTAPEVVDLEADLSSTERIDRRVDELLDELPATAVAAGLESETRQRDVSLGFEAGASRGGLSRAVLAGVGVGAAFGVLLAGATIAAAGNDVSLEWLPVLGPTVPAWAPLVAGLVAVVAGASAPGVGRRLRETVGGGGGPEFEPEQRDRLETVGAILERHSLERDEDPYRGATAALESQPIQPVRRGAVHTATRLLAPVVPAVLVVGATWFLLGTLPAGTEAAGLFVLGAVALVARVALGVRTVGAGIGALLSGSPSESREATDQRDEGADTSAEEDDSSDLGIRAADETAPNDADADSASRGTDRDEGTDDSAPAIGEQSSADGADADDGETTGSLDPIRDDPEPDDDAGGEPDTPSGASDTPPGETDTGGFDSETGDGPQGTEVDRTGDDGTGIGGTGGNETGIGVSGAETGADEADEGEGEVDEMRDAEAGGAGETGDDGTGFDGANEGETLGSAGTDRGRGRDTGGADDGEATEAAPDDGGRGGESERDGAKTSSDGTSAEGFVRSAETGGAGSGGREPTTRGPFEQFFDEFPVTTAPVVTGGRVFVAGDAGLHDHSVPVDEAWLPERHLDTVRRERARGHLTRLTHDGERDHTIPFTSTFAEPIVGGEGTVYVLDASSTVAALGEAGGPAIETFQHPPQHFSADQWLYVSDRRGSRILGTDLRVQQELSGVFSVPPMVAGESITLCFEEQQTRRINIRDDRVTEFSAPGGELIGSVVAGGTPYVASESGVIWSGWERGWEKQMDAHRTGFRWLTAGEQTVVLAGRSVVYARDTRRHQVDSLETTVTTAPVVTDDAVYFGSNGELVRADLGLSATSRMDLPWPSIDGLTAGTDRLFVVADGAVWTVPFSAVR